MQTRFAEMQTRFFEANAEATATKAQQPADPATAAWARAMDDRGRVPGPGAGTRAFRPQMTARQFADAILARGDGFVREVIALLTAPAEEVA
jgi:hypothetical protein